MTEKMQKPSGEEGGSPRCKRLLRRGLAAVAVVLILLLLLLHALPLITNTGPVRTAAERAVSEFLDGAEVSIGTLRVAPVHRRLLLIEDLSLDRTGDAEVPAVEVGRVECRWLPRALLRGTLHLTAVSVDVARIHLRRQDGEWNLPMPPPRAEPPEMPLPTRIDAVKVRELRIDAAVPGLAKAQIEPVSLKGACVLRPPLDGRAVLAARSGRVTAEARSLRATLDDGFAVWLNGFREGAKGGAAITFEAETAGAEVPGLGAFGPLPLEAFLSVTADLNSPEAPAGLLRVASPGTFQELLSFSFGPNPPHSLSARNHFHLDLGAALSAAPPELPLTLAGEVTAVTDVRAEVKSGPDRVLDVDLSSEFSAGGLRGSAEVPAGDRPVRAQLRGADLLVRQDASLRMGATVGGTVDTDLTWRADGVGASIGELLLETSGLEGRLSGSGVLPAVGAAVGSVSLGELSVKRQGTGLALGPVELTLELDGRGLAEPSAARLRLKEATARIADVAPRLSAFGAADGLSRRVSLEATGALDFARLREFVGDLAAAFGQSPPELRGRGALGGSLSIRGELPEGPRGGFCIDALGDVDLANPGFGRGGLDVGVARGEAGAELAAALDARLQPFGVTSSGHARLAGVDVATLDSETSLDAAEADFELDALNDAVSGLRAGGNLDVRGLSLPAPAETEALPSPPSPLSFEAAGMLEVSPAAADLRLTDVSARLPGGVAFGMERLLLEGLGMDGVDGTIAVTIPDVGSALRQLGPWLGPPATKIPLSPSGSLETEATVTGELPIIGKFLTGLLSDRGAPSLDYFPLRGFYERNIPLDANARLSIEQFRVEPAIPEAPPLRVRDGSAHAEFNLTGGNARAGLVAELPLVEWGASGVPMENLRMDSELKMSDFDKVSLEKFEFNGLGGFIELSAGGRAEGLSRLRSLPRPADLLSTLNLTLDSSGTVRPAKLALLEPLNTSGRINWSAQTRLDAGSAVRLQLVPELRDLSVRLDPLAVLKGLDGFFPFEKRWRIVEGAEETPSFSRRLIEPVPPRPAEGPTQLPDYSTAVQQLLSPGRELAVETLSLLGAPLIDDAAAELTGRGSEFAIPRFYFRSLGGNVAGRLSFRPTSRGRELILHSEFAEVDFNRLQPALRKKLAADATVTGTLALSVELSPEADADYNVIKGVTCRLNVTRIGSDALDRLLLALDPEGERPAVVRVRKVLKLARPARVEARMERGFAWATVELEGLPGGLSASYSIPRINVAALLGSSLLKEMTGRVVPLLGMLDVLDADALILRPDGSVELAHRREDIGGSAEPKTEAGATP